MDPAEFQWLGALPVANTPLFSSGVMFLHGWISLLRRPKTRDTAYVMVTQSFITIVLCQMETHTHAHKYTYHHLSSVFAAGMGWIVWLELVSQRATAGSSLSVFIWFLWLLDAPITNYNMECTQCLICATSMDASNVSLAQVPFTCHWQWCLLHVTDRGTFYVSPTVVPFVFHQQCAFCMSQTEAPFICHWHCPLQWSH